MNLQIEYVEADSLQAAAWNPRKISKDNLRRLGKLLDAHGFVLPIVARRKDRLVVGGHQRLQANRLRENPDRRVPVIFLDDVSDLTCKALNVGLNNLDAQGQFDTNALERLIEDMTGPCGDDVKALSQMTAIREKEIDLLRRSCRGLEPVVPLENDAEPICPDVLILFEIPRERFETLRPALDDFIARHDLDCSIRQ